MTTAPATSVPDQSAPQTSPHAALLLRTRPARPGPFSAVLTHFWRVTRSFKHHPAQLLDVILMPLIFLLMFTYLFGGAFAGSTREYLQYFLPGVLVQTVTLMTVYTGTALSMDITKGIFDRFRTLPFWQPATIVGNLLGDVVRYVIALTITIGVGILMGFRPDSFPATLLAVALLILFAFSVSWMFAALGIVAKAPESVSSTSMVVIFPLVFTSNIFVDPSTMPGWMQAIVSVNPISHATTATRGLMHGTATSGELALVLITSGAIIAVFAPLTMWLYARRVQR
ncbi:ABC transporter permease [Micromonospora sp. NPDC049559]|uniref:ABC transporter permease n=1 Tax=Micromonospora sp. NPDC049559 TaxID=3155923 RepID=UPI003435DD88